MARKRSHAQKKTKKHSSDNPKLDRWETADDIEKDSEDECAYLSLSPPISDISPVHHQNDMLSLGDTAEPSDDDSDNEQEVYALNNVGDSDDEEEIGDYQDVPDDAVEYSEEENDDDENQEDDFDDQKLKSWGSKQGAYYARQDENLSSDDEDDLNDHKLEEEEALKLQKNSRQDWNWEDVTGLDDADDDENAQEDTMNLDEPEVEEEPAVDLSGLSRAEKIAYLQKTSPETLALLTDYEDILSKIKETDDFIQKRKEEDENHPALGLLYVYHQTLLTYAPLLTYFICLKASSEYVNNRSKLLQHPVLKRMVTLREGIARMEDLGFGPGDEQQLPDEDDEEQEDIRNMIRQWAANKEQTEDMDDSWKDETLEDGELEGLMTDENAPPAKPKKKSKKSSKKGADVDSRNEMIHELDESALEYKPSTSAKSQKQKQRVSDDDYLGEADALSALDAQSKKNNKKTLRFHTARIAQTDSRRSAASKLRQSGDDDVPYRERKKARLEKGATSAPGEDLDGGDWTAQDEATRRQIMNEADLGETATGDDGDDYYELVRQSKKAAKQAKKEEYDDARWKSRVDYVDETGVDGPRHLPREIALNKAVTPARSFKHSKLNRNPRLKKRVRYDQAQKKLKSMKPVYQGGPEGGQYEGEKTGITRNVKSTKF
ncbi:hypothetical protein E3Q04_03178 [Wallemia mellicola]|nr:hypothetical protein E3Q04_03178 [Wallemia mellicola]